MSHSTRQALIVIDIQNDYFADGLFPLWEAEQTLERIIGAVDRAQAREIPVIFVQHLGAENAPFFRAGTVGAEIHPRLRAAAPSAPVVVKGHADAFLETSLAATLAPLRVDELLLCGMMTQNCVTHTAISRQAENYSVTVLGDCCTSVSPMIHLIALKALRDRVAVTDSAC